ncbi:MAG TPA: SMC-Scp complex subunit ScpB [Planctomycetaceae bacterium]|nr:SMC-Scp complex subunit ScpB [Planctomycetaceae bacterium]
MSAPIDSPQGAGPSAVRDQTWSVEEIERLYQKALDAVDAVANDLNAATDVLSSPPEADQQEESFDLRDPPGVADSAVRSESHKSASSESDPVAPEQVIEALLFVGGKPLTIKAMGAVLRGEFDAVFIETAIEQLRDRYTNQNRPYEIRLTDGGYCLALRPEFEPERNRVYGFGPRQVRLSQETLEVLSLVAYRQPISRTAIEEIAKRGAGSHLRQLLQRELLVLDRKGGSPDGEVTYRTSPRFLQVFGLRRLEELPQIEDLDFK